MVGPGVGAVCGFRCLWGPVSPRRRGRLCRGRRGETEQVGTGKQEAGPGGPCAGPWCPPVAPACSGWQLSAKDTLPRAVLAGGVD